MFREFHGGTGSRMGAHPPYYRDIGSNPIFTEDDVQGSDQFQKAAQALAEYPNVTKIVFQQ